MSAFRSLRINCVINDSASVSVSFSSNSSSWTTAVLSHLPLVIIARPSIFRDGTKMDFPLIRISVWPLLAAPGPDFTACSFTACSTGHMLNFGKVSMCPVEQAVKEQAVKSGPGAASSGQTEIRIKGKSILVPSLNIDGRAIITSGKWLKTAVVHDEELLENETLTDAESFITQLMRSDLKADIFTFSQRLPHTTPKFSYSKEWDNFAVIPITTYCDWFKNRIESSVQRAIRKAAKTGIEVRV